MFTDFDISEYGRRLEQAQRLMAERQLDALFMTTQANIRYFTGHQTHRWLQPTAPIFAIVPRQGTPVTIMPAIEIAMAKASPWITDARPFRGYCDIAVKEIRQALRELSFKSGLVGAELGDLFHIRMPLKNFTAIRESVPGVQFVDASEIFWKLRIPKSFAELQYVRQAVRITDQAYQTVFQSVQPGMTERQVFQIMAKSLMEYGANSLGSVTVCSRSSGEDLPWNSHLRLYSDRTVQEGDLVWMDAGCVVNGYWSDFLRMFCVGKATPQWKAAYRFIYESVHLCIQETQPGAPISNLIARYEKKMRHSPYADLADSLKLSRIGHSCGLELIELPSISFVDKTILEPGTVLTIEPCISGNEGFFMLEEDVLVTETGFEILSDPAPAELLEIG